MGGFVNMPLSSAIIFQWKSHYSLGLVGKRIGCISLLLPIVVMLYWISTRLCAFEVGFTCLECFISGIIINHGI